MFSPCMRCEKVADPRQCGDKDCGLWRQWYIRQWNAMRRQVKENMEQKAGGPSGCNIGGTYYETPHRVRGYLDNDPCKACKCPKELCLVPCGVKRRWLNARREVYGS